MDNFGFDVLWALLVTAVTLGADWIAGQLISAIRTLTAIKQSVDKGVADGQALSEIKAHLEKLQARRAGSLIWGADLVAVAISLDIAALGIWISDKSTFPFFKIWDTTTSEKEIEVWGLLLLSHFFLLMLSIVIKHFHGETIESVPTGSLAQLFHRGWMKQNAWMVTCNALGFVTLLSSFMILTYRV